MEFTFVSKYAITPMVPITVSATKAMCWMMMAMLVKVSTAIIIVQIASYYHGAQTLMSAGNKLMSVIRTVKILLVLTSVVALVASF